ncbi:MAG: hypothetical protein M3261_01710, partial [Thermoproteota archaeon]|nr:hypothetical protein [Thermoproteota archaeon]
MIHLNNKNNTGALGIIPALLTLAIMTATPTLISPAVATTTTLSMAQPATVTTDNQSVNVLISWEPIEIEPGQDAQFTLNFQDPSTGESIRHVNYNFEIKDQNSGRTIQSMTGLHSHSGTDEQMVTFDTTGSYNLIATIIGTGIDPPFDTTKSGAAQTVINVGQQVASATTSTGDVAIGAQSACDPTQIARGGRDGSQNATADNTITTTARGSNTKTVDATTTNTTTTEGIGNQTTTSSPTQ